MKFKEIPGWLFRKRWLWIALSFLLLILIAVLADFLYYRERAYPGIYLNDTGFGGMKLIAVEAYLEENLWTAVEARFLFPEGEEKIIPLEALGVAWDMESTLQDIARAGRGVRGYRDRFLYLFSKKRIQVDPVLSFDYPRMDLLFAELASAIYRAPRDACFVVEGDTVSIVPGKAGRFLEEQLLRERIVEGVLHNKLEIDIPAEEWPPVLSESDLDQYGVKNVMVTFYTDVAAGDPNRANNIDLGSRAINGFLLAPGEIFSFFETVGRATREKGYREAPIILGDDLVPGLGGGLCQVSSTLYNAALLANLEIVERHNHSLTVAYLPLGRDAAVADGHLDLKFRNDSDKYLIIGAELVNLRLTFRIFGIPMDERVEIVSSGWSTIPPPEIYRETSDLPKGVTELHSAGKPGYHITTWRVVYRGDREISREMLSRDYYRPTASVYLVGTGR